MWRLRRASSARLEIGSRSASVFTCGRRSARTPPGLPYPIPQGPSSHARCARARARERLRAHSIVRAANALFFHECLT